MAREENVDSARLLRSFERRFLATRGLRSFPWQVGGRARGGLAGAAGDGRGLGYQIRPLRHATASTPLVPRQDLRSWSPGCAKDREDWQWGADVHLRVLAGFPPNSLFTLVFRTVHGNFYDFVF